jgi:hypothetical protein
MQLSPYFCYFNVLGSKYLRYHSVFQHPQPKCGRPSTTIVYSNSLNYGAVVFCRMFKTFCVTACYDMLYRQFETHCKLTFCAVVLNSGPVLHISVSQMGLLFLLTLYPCCEIRGLIGAFCMWFMMKSEGYEFSINVTFI